MPFFYSAPKAAVWIFLTKLFEPYFSLAMILRPDFQRLFSALFKTIGLVIEMYTYDSVDPASDNAIMG